MYIVAKYRRFLFFTPNSHFLKKNTKAIVQGFSKNGVFRYETKSNSFLSDCSSIICPESVYQKL